MESIFLQLNTKPPSTLHDLPRACELPCMLVLRGLFLDWMTARTKHCLLVRVERDRSMSQPKGEQPRRGGRENWEKGREACVFTKSFLHIHGIQAGSRNETPAAPWVPNASPAIIHGTRYPYPSPNTLSRCLGPDSRLGASASAFIISGRRRHTSPTR